MATDFALDAPCRICLVLSRRTLAEDATLLLSQRPLVDMAELRVDMLDAAEQPFAAAFARSADLPLILTIRRKADGGLWAGDEEARAALHARLLKEGEFVFVDFEDDFRRDDLSALAQSRGTRVIRSLHDFTGPRQDIPSLCRRLRGVSGEIPKIAFQSRSLDDTARLFRECAAFTEMPHILCAMGPCGVLSRVLASRTHSLLTFASADGEGRLPALGHLTPAELAGGFRFRELSRNGAMELVGVVGTDGSRCMAAAMERNRAFAAAGETLAAVPIVSGEAAERASCAAVLGITRLEEA